MCLRALSFDSSSPWICLERQRRINLARSCLLLWLLVSDTQKDNLFCSGQESHEQVKLRGD